MKIPLTRYWSLLSHYLRGQARLFLSLAFVLTAGIGFTLLIPQVTRRFVDGASHGLATRDLMWLAVLFLVTAVLAQGLNIAATWLGEVVAWNATNRLRTELAGHCLDLDMSFHKGKTPGEMIERLDEDVTALARFFSQLVVLVGGNLLLVIGILAMFLRENLWLGAIFGVFAFASLYLLNQLREIAIPHEVERRKVLAELFGYLEERLAGTEDIRANGAVQYVINGLFRIQSDLLVRWRTVQLRYWALGSVSRWITTAGSCLAIGAGFYLYNRGLITMGTAFLIVHYMALMARPLRELSAQVEQLQGVGASIERVAELVDERGTLLEGTRRLEARGPISLQFDHVDFGYEPGDPVLKDVSVDLAPGAVMGLLGRTGSGKTTMARLMFRLYDVDRGAVLVGGHNVRELTRASLMHNVAMVTQDVQLFRASVRDNLTFFDRSFPDDVLLEVLKNVELWEWFKRQPGGLDTVLDTDGRSMSAGEAQLLAFARVLLKDPALVVLDEASSRLDPATEAKIERTIDKLFVNRTAIVIAHRLGTVQRADDILILDSGRVRESGPRRELLEDPDSEFSRLMAVGLEEVLA